MIDRGVALRFTTHIGIAEGELERIQGIPRRLEAMERGDGLSQSLMNELALDWAKGWENVWTQLGEARAVVVALGRDVRMFDTARATAGDIYVHTATGTAVHIGNAVHVRWRNSNTQTAHAAISALRAAMPEVPFVPPSPPVNVDLRSSSSQTLAYVLYSACAVLAAYVVFRLVT